MIKVVIIGVSGFGDIHYKDLIRYQERGELENEKLRTQIVQEKIKVLKNLGVPEEKIRKALFEHVIKPLGELDAIQDKRLVVDAEIIEGKSSDHSLDDSRKF